ncbi:hypothetical protein U9M48_011030 [Paspalum notatum var. saurae]|uniref:Uncharacterized protein n=1 Tax=Paspalum notatum var. saurae TaxID=547442 RepID=A0AAQ3WH32_PASNO
MAVGDLAFKALTAGLGVATLYLAATFSVNVYRGLSWHSEQSSQAVNQASKQLNFAFGWPGWAAYTQLITPYITPTAEQVSTFQDLQTASSVR